MKYLETLTFALFTIIKAFQSEEIQLHPPLKVIKDSPYHCRKAFTDFALWGKHAVVTSRKRSAIAALAASFPTRSDLCKWLVVGGFSSCLLPSNN